MPVDPYEPQPSIRQLDTSDPGAGGGRGFWYEWELRDTELRQQIDDVAGGGGGGGGSFTFTQTNPSSVWTIDHNLGFIPNVIVVDASGELVFSEVRHPSVNRTVVTHGMPFAGTAYLRN